MLASSPPHILQLWTKRSSVSPNSLLTQRSCSYLRMPSLSPSHCTRLSRLTVLRALLALAFLLTMAHLLYTEVTAKLQKASWLTVCSVCPFGWLSTTVLPIPSLAFPVLSCHLIVHRLFLYFLWSQNSLYSVAFP